MKIVRQAMVTSAERRDPCRYRGKPVCKLTLLVDVGGEPAELVMPVSDIEFEALWRDVAARGRVKVTFEFEETPAPTRTCLCGRPSLSDRRWCGADCDAAWKHKPVNR